MALGREGEEAGIEYWCQVINMGQGDMQTKMLNVSTSGFFHSPEFTNKNLSDEEFVKVCYRTFLGRECDKNGFDYWVKKLRSGRPRDEVMAGFAYSPEFANIMASYIK